MKTRRPTRVAERWRRYRIWWRQPLHTWSDRRWRYFLIYITTIAIAVTIVLNVWVFPNWSR